MIGFRVQGSGFRIRGSGVRVQETSEVRGQRSAVGIHSSSFILYPSSFILHPSRRGLSLLEVLFAIGILAIGLLGVAAIIPLGQIALWETDKADRSGACGRAALRDIQVRRMLDFRYWYWMQDPIFPSNYYWGFIPPATNIPDVFSIVSSCYDSLPFAIDPLGRARGLPERFGWTTTTINFLPRRTLRAIPLMPNQSIHPPAISPALAEQLFFSFDDLPFSETKNSSERPRLITVIDPITHIPRMVSEGTYSWFFTVLPATTEMSLPVAQRRLFKVSVVVCYKRNFDLASLGTSQGEHTAIITANTPTTINGFPGMGLGGGTVKLDAGSSVNVKENQWVMLYHLHIDPVTGITLPGYPELNRCHWYRVVGVGGNTNTLSLVGPDWDPTLSATLVVVPGAIGVYTTTMELDWDPLWTK